MSPGVDRAIARWRELLAKDPIANNADELHDRIRAAELLEGGRSVCSVLRPRFVRIRRHADEQRVAARIVTVLGRALAAVERGSVPEEVTGGLAEWVRRVRQLDPSPAARVPTFLRLDASLARTQLHVLELNADMPAGEAHNDSVIDLLECLPTTRAFTTEHGGELPRLLPAFDRAIDEATASPARVAWVIWDEAPERRGVVESMAKHLERRGVESIFTDPRNLDVGDRVTEVAGEGVDAILRLCSTPEILARHAAAAPLLAVARAGHTPILNPLGTEPLGHKALLAVVTDPTVDVGLSPGERRAVTRHVPWTRLLRDARTLDPHGVEVDLLPWVLEYRSWLVLKPAHGFAGRGVVLGWRCADGEWEEAVRSGAGRSIVQHRVHLQREPYPVIDEGLEDAEFYEDSDPFLFGSQVGGVLTRLSTSEITNVAKGGSVTATMVLS